MWQQILTGGTLARAAGCALAYVAAAALGDAFSPEAGPMAVFWPANALLLGLLLQMPPRDCPAILATSLVAAVAANLGYNDDPLYRAVARAAVNIVEVLCGYLLIARFNPTLTLTDLRSLLILAAASMAAPAVSATAAAILLDQWYAMPFPDLWWARWSRDVVGMLLFLPLIASFDPKPIKRLLAGPWDRRLLAEAAELAAAFALLFVMFVLITRGHWYASPTLFAPILLWTSLRFGIFPTAAAAVTIDLVAVMSATFEAWPALFMAADTPEEFHSLQLFVLLVALPPLVVAVVVGEHARARRQLDDALESMADAFALYDVRDRLVLCNARYPAFLSRIADLVVPGVRYEELVREGVRRGLYPGVEPAQAEAWIAEQVAAHRAGATEVQLADGRWLHAVARPTADGGTVDVRRDITERKLLEEAIEHMAMHDALTDRPNRAMFYRELERALARAERESCRIAVILVDLDHFKEVNDTFGHAGGDQLLVEIAHGLVDCVRTEDLVARLGGDEFAVVAVSREATDGFAALAERIVARMSERTRIGGIEIEPGASLGMTVFPDDPGGLDELVVHADRALYAAKQTGRGTWKLFEDGMGEGRADSPRLCDDLGGALERGEFDLEYQPIVGIGSLEVIGFEALLRWNYPRRGRLPANSFIAAAERTPAIVRLTRFVLASALRQQRAWRDEGLGDWPVWVNLASRCLRRDGLSDLVARELAASGVAPNRLVLEVTESALVDLERAEGRVDALRRLGVGLALDDFGTGYSSLGRLRALPMDALKIDRSFVGDLARNERDRALVRSMVALGENLGLTPMAEGVETSVQLRELRRCGCVWAQGHLFARPMPPQAVAAWLAAWEAPRRLHPEDDLLKRKPDGGRSA